MTQQIETKIVGRNSTMKSHGTSLYENDAYDAMDNAFLVPVMPVTNKIGLDLRTRRASRTRQ